MGHLNITYIATETLQPSEYNPRKWSKDAIAQLKASVRKYGLVDPLLANSAPARNNIVIGGHFRLAIAKELKIAEVPVVYLNIPDLEREKELCIRLNKNTGEFDWDLLASGFAEAFLADIGFSSEELDDIFATEDNPETFDLEKELKKLNIENIAVQKGDVYTLGNHRLMCGDSTVQEDIERLMGDEKADMCFTDPPYILDYLRGKKRRGKATEGFGYKRDRKYLETDVLPPDFTEKWSGNKIYHWLRFDLNFRTKSNHHLTRSNIYRILQSHFYYGVFEYPQGSGNFYTGKHQPILSRELYEKVQEQLKREVTKRESKEFAFTRILKCGLCGSGITADEKYKKQQNGNVHRYVYYGCTRSRDLNCKGGYMREEELINQLVALLDKIDINELGMRHKLEEEIMRFHKFQNNVLGTKSSSTPKVKEIDVRAYAKYLLKEGSIVEKRELLSQLKGRIIIKDKKLHLER